MPNGYLEFNVKGRAGGENFRIGFVDHFGQRRPEEIQSGGGLRAHAWVKGRRHRGGAAARAYTAHVQGTGSATGVALVKVYCIEDEK